MSANIQPGLKVAANLAGQKSKELLDQYKLLTASRWSRFLNRALITNIAAQMTATHELWSQIIELRLASSSTDDRV